MLFLHNQISFSSNLVSNRKHFSFFVFTSFRFSFSLLFVLCMFASMIQMSNKSVRAKTLLDEIVSLPHEIMRRLDIVYAGKLN